MATQTLELHVMHAKGSAAYHIDLQYTAGQMTYCSSCQANGEKQEYELKVFWVKYTRSVGNIGVFMNNVVSLHLVTVADE